MKSYFSMTACESLLYSQSKQEGQARNNLAPEGLFTKVRGKQRADKGDTKAGPATWSTNMDYHASPATGQGSSVLSARKPPALVTFYSRHLKG